MRIVSWLADRWHTALAVTVFVGLLAWNAYMVAQLRPGAKAPPQQANAVICTNCDWQGWRETLKLPQRCPECHKMTLHFAGICPKCGEWTPWNIDREQLLYAQPRLFMQKGPGWFFPRCRGCGSPTNATGAPFPAAAPEEPDTRRPAADNE